jgi:hypothetical protein
MLTDTDIRAIREDRFTPILKELSTGEVLALRRLMFGTELAILPPGYAVERAVRSSYFYEERVEATIALVTWTGAGDPPGSWSAAKPACRPLLFPGRPAETVIGW